MAPRKRMKSVGSGPSIQRGFDNEKFTSLETQLRFNSDTRHRSFVKERALDVGEGQFPEIRDEVMRRGWREFCTHPSACCLTIVKEFYANAYIKKTSLPTFKSFVRGVVIHFDGNTINELFGIPPIGSDCSVKYMKSINFNHEAVKRALCIGGTGWDWTSKGDPKILEKANLLPVPKAVCTFTQASVLPCSNLSEVPVERVLFIYNFLAGNPINLGDIIANAIHSFAHSARGTLGFPSLIYKLCLSAGVLCRIDDPFAPTQMVTAKTIKSRANEPSDEAEAPTQSIPRGPRVPRTNQERLDTLEKNQRLLAKNQKLIMRGQKFMMNQLAMLTSNLGFGTSQGEDPLEGNPYAQVNLESDNEEETENLEHDAEHDEEREDEHDDH